MLLADIEMLDTPMARNQATPSLTAFSNAMAVDCATTISGIQDLGSFLSFARKNNGFWRLMYSNEEMLPSPAILRSAADGRITVVKDKLPEWMTPGEPFFLVPLHWKRELGLGEDRRLEAWYAWRGEAHAENWRIDPLEVKRSTDPEAFYLQQLIYPAYIDIHTRSHRLNCESLLRELGHRSDSRVWLSAEPGSIAIWTDSAFQTWFGRLWMQ